MLDLVIIGGGIAGITAAIYAKRAGIENFMFIEKAMLGGQIKFIDKIDNFPGVSLGTSGFEFMSTMQKQLDELDIKVDNKDIAEICKCDDGTFVIHTACEEKIATKAIVCATGAAPRRLGLESEGAYVGKGLSYCAVCDGFFFRNKTVAVVGGGNSALEEALYLSKIASKVYLIHRRDEFRAFDYVVEHVKNTENIELVLDSTIEQIKGEELISAVAVKNVKTNDVKDIELQGIFIAIGYKPSTDLVADLAELDDSNFVVVDKSMNTSQKGIFACGDCIQKDLKQLVTSASEGAVAAMSAYNYIENS